MKYVHKLQRQYAEPKRTAIQPQSLVKSTPHAREFLTFYGILTLNKPIFSSWNPGTLPHKCCDLPNIRSN